MAYSAEVVSRARARLAQAKEDRESENRQHLAAAYAKVPRLREIDLLLRRTMAAVLLSSGAKGKRYCLPNSMVLIHQPLGGAQGQQTEIQIVADFMKKTRLQLNDR